MRPAPPRPRVTGRTVAHPQWTWLADDPGFLPGTHAGRSPKGPTSPRTSMTGNPTGFHDTANAMATSIATRALRPQTAVALSGVLNLIGAFLSVEVALTVTNAVVKIQNSDGTPKPDLLAGGGYDLLLIVLAGLVGGIVWNLLTWLLGLPSSSSHALFGGLIGAAIA